MAWLPKSGVGTGAGRLSVLDRRIVDRAVCGALVFAGLQVSQVFAGRWFSTCENFPLVLLGLQRAFAGFTGLTGKEREREDLHTPARPAPPSSPPPLS